MFSAEVKFKNDWHLRFIPQTNICRGSDGLVRHPVTIRAFRRVGHFSLIFRVLGEYDYQKHIVKWSPASWNTVKIFENAQKVKIFAPVGRQVARPVARELGCSQKPLFGVFRRCHVFPESLQQCPQSVPRVFRMCLKSVPKYFKPVPI